MNGPWIRPLVLVLAAALWGMTTDFAQFASAADEQDHGAHHPPAASEAPPAPPAPSGEMSNGMMGKDGQRGMMMGRDMKDMMSMMRDMMGMMSAQASNIETRIASLKTELKITDAQAPQWDRFAEALRTAVKSMSGVHQKMMAQGMGGTLLARLDRQEAMLTAHLASVKSLKEALEPLYASFSDEQKKIADGMMIGPMGVM